MQGKELNKRFSTEVQWLGLSTVIKTVNFQCNDQRHVEYVKINRYRQLALDGVVDTHMDFTSSGAGSSPTYGGPQLSKIVTAKTKYLTAKPKTSQRNQKPHGKNKNIMAKPKTSRQKQNTSRQNQILQSKIALVLPWGFCFFRDDFGFAVTVVGHHTLHQLPTVFFLLLFTTLSYKSPILWVKVTIWL